MPNDRKPTTHVWVQIGIICLALATASFCQSCSQPPPAAADYRHIPGEAEQFEAELSDEDRAEIAEAFRHMAEGHQCFEAPAASAGVRWVDLELAVGYACDETELAITKTTAHNWGTEYRLLTIEGYPGTLSIRRIDGPTVYEAEAVIGLYGDRTERAQRLVQAIDEQMRAFAKKRRFQD